MADSQVDSHRIYGFTDEQLAILKLSWRPGLFDGQVVLVSGAGTGQSRHPMTQIATRSLFENQDVRVWEMDVAPGDTFGLHHHSNDYVLYITGGADLRVDDKNFGPYDFIGHERSVFYIKADVGGGFHDMAVDNSRFRRQDLERHRWIVDARRELNTV